jgi:predicted nucleic acid-binding protein
MTVFFDTNILLDVLSNRQPHVEAAARLWAAVEAGSLKAVISAISFNNIYYIIRKAGGAARAREALVLLNSIFTTASLDSAILQEAIASKIGDFEDAIQYFSAIRAGAAHLVTRDAWDFPDHPMSVISPDELVAMLSSQNQT